VAKKADKTGAPKRVRKKDPIRELAVAAARLAHDSNCEDIQVLDLRGRSPVTDYFIIATGTSGRQLRSVADDLAAYGKAAGTKAWHIEGQETAQWILLDFVDFVVHLFDEETRHYYDLELMWGDSPRVRWQRRTAK
jgi:ribosome-associated protein